MLSVGVNSVVQGSLQSLTPRAGVRIKWEIIGKALATMTGLVDA